MDVNRVIHGDALEVLRGLDDASVDAIITDPPYGTTACAWDTPIDLVSWWAAVRRVVKRNAAIVMTASQPFTSALVMSKAKWFKYGWIWRKNMGSNFATTDYQPMKEHEDILVFCLGTVAYNPQPQQRNAGGFAETEIRHMNPANRVPSSVLEFHCERGLHPTQKPVALMEYLIRTYTQPGDLVLDPFAGSGTTLVAARNLQRRYLGVELMPEYVAIAERRLSMMYTPDMFEHLDAAD